MTLPNGSVMAFAELFRGRTDAYGTLFGGVRRLPVTLDHYRAHLEERTSLGVFPMCDGDVVHFGAIDLDEPDFDLARDLQRFIPGASFVERSRSGNAHVWVFFAEPAPAWSVRSVLRYATAALSRPEVEVFPKQDRLRDGMVGNYINLPYFGEHRPMVVEGQTALPLENFLVEALARKHDPRAWVRRAEALGAVAPEARRERRHGELGVMHECALHIVERRHENPIRAGHRHQVLFRLACMFLNYQHWTDEDAWETLLLMNEEGVLPSLPVSELRSLFHNARAGRYTSTGCDDPLMAPYVRRDCPIFRGEAGR